MHFSRPLGYVFALLVLGGTTFNKHILFFRNLPQERECMKPWGQGPNVLSLLFCFLQVTSDSLQACFEKL